MANVTQTKSTRRRSLAEINTVPYIDVMLVLLVIFMVTAPLLNQGVKIDLPQATANPIPPEAKQPLIITVDSEGLYYLNQSDQPEQPLSADSLRQQVSALLVRTPDVPVMVRGDTAVPYGQVVRAMTVLQSAGAPSIGLMTEPPENR